jgi:hypothetical protein
VHERTTAMQNARNFMGMQAFKLFRGVSG